MNNLEGKETPKNAYLRIGPFEGILLIAVIAILAALIRPLILGGGEPPLGIRLISLSKQIATASILYLVDYDERLPFVEPCEFAVDPLEQYHRRATMYLNPTMVGPMSGFDRRGSDIVFQFVVERPVFNPRRSSRTILDVTKLEHATNSILLWTPFWGKEYIIVAFADSHVKAMKPPIRSELVPNLDGLMGVRGRLVGPKEEWPPPTWSVPIKDVLAYAEKAKKELAKTKSPNASR